MKPNSIQNVDRWCKAHGLRATEGRRAVTRIILASRDYPDAGELHRRIRAVNPRISLASVYRTLRILTELGLIERHTFQDGRARYGSVSDRHCDHLIDITSGKVIEVRSPEIELLQDKIAHQLGFRLTGRRLELYGEPLQRPQRSHSPIGARPSSRHTLG